jgi:hypothetical protein
MKIEPKGAGIMKNHHLKDFLSDHIYIQLFSLRGCSVKVTARFPKDEEEAENLKKRTLSRGSQMKKLQL